MIDWEHNDLFTANFRKEQNHVIDNTLSILSSGMIQHREMKDKGLKTQANQKRFLFIYIQQSSTESQWEAGQ